MLLPVILNEAKDLIAVCDSVVVSPGDEVLRCAQDNTRVSSEPRRPKGVALTALTAPTPLWPLHLGRQRHQDRLDVAAGHQAEPGAAVVQQVELDVAAAPHELVLALGRRPRLVHVG